MDSWLLRTPTRSHGIQRWASHHPPSGCRFPVRKTGLGIASSFEVGMESRRGPLSGRVWRLPDPGMPMVREARGPLPGADATGDGHRPDITAGHPVRLVLGGRAAQPGGRGTEHSDSRGESRSGWSGRAADVWNGHHGHRLLLNTKGQVSPCRPRDPRDMGLHAVLGRQPVKSRRGELCETSERASQFPQ